MRKLALLAIFLALPVFGCKTVTTPLPANAVNSLDAGINEVLQAGHAAAAKYQADVAAATFTPTPAFKSRMTTLIKALNVADPAYQAYHAALVANPAAAEPAPLASAISTVSSSLSQITQPATQ